MSIKVRNSLDGEHYLLVGTGYGMHSATSPSSSLLLGQANEQTGHADMVALCDATGAIRWERSRNIQVVEIDGKSPEEWLS